MILESFLSVPESRPFSAQFFGYFECKFYLRRKGDGDGDGDNDGDGEGEGDGGEGNGDNDCDG